jgi:hypothetical protein
LGTAAATAAIAVYHPEGGFDLVSNSGAQDLMTVAADFRSS